MPGIPSKKGDLILKYQTWLKENGYPPLSADELASKLHVDQHWLGEFIREWNAADE